MSRENRKGTGKRPGALRLQAVPGLARTGREGEVILGRTPSPTPRPEDREEMALYRRMKGRQEGHQAGRDRGCPERDDPARPHGHCCSSL